MTTSIFDQYAAKSQVELLVLAKKTYSDFMDIADQVDEIFSLCNAAQTDNLTIKKMSNHYIIFHLIHLTAADGSIAPEECELFTQVTNIPITPREVVNFLIKNPELFKDNYSTTVPASLKVLCHKLTVEAPSILPLKLKQELMSMLCKAITIIGLCMISIDGEVDIKEKLDHGKFVVTCQDYINATIK